MPECFVVMDDNLLKVLFDLPGDMEIERMETVDVLASDGSSRKVHMVHFTSEHEKWVGQLDFQYVINRDTGATSLHSIRYSSTNREEGSHAAPQQDAGRAGR